MNRKINKPVDWLKKQIAIGRSRKDMARELGVEVGTLSRWAKRNGLRITTPPHRTRKYGINHHYFDIIDTEIKAYALGLIATDGSIDKYGWQLKVSINKEDSDVLDLIRKDMQSDCPIGKTKDGRRVLAVYSVDIVKSLAKYGIVNNKTFTCPFVTFGTKSLMLHYVRGIMDGDGSMGKQPRLVTASKPFMLGFSKWYERNYGQSCYVYTESGINAPKYRFVFNRRDKHFVHDLYLHSKIRMTRKFNKYLEHWN